MFVSIAIIRLILSVSLGTKIISLIAKKCLSYDSNDSNFSPFNTKNVLFLGGGKTYSEDCKRFFN